mgnify:CR=1 FL=1
MFSSIKITKKKFIFLLSFLIILSTLYIFIPFINPYLQENPLSNNLFISIILSLLLISFIYYYYDSFKKSSLNYQFKYWSKNSLSLKSIINYIKLVTNEKSDFFIPEQERIALFDFDGTIYGEKGPLYVEYYMYYDFLKNNPEFLKQEPHKSIYNRLKRSCEAKKLIDFELEFDAIEAEAKVYKGFSIEEHKNFVRKFAEKNVKCFSNLKYKDMFYLPMIELIDFLKKNNFIIYVVSASDRFLVREYLKYHFEIPEQNVIATDVELMPKSEEKNFDKTGKINEYLNFEKNDYLIRNGNLIKKNVQLSKVRMIAREIGKIPVLSFGNSNSDVPLQNYVLSGKKYKNEVYMVVADDIKREYGVDFYDDKGNLNTNNSEEIKRKWKSGKYGYNIISMRDDFKTIYGDNVTLIDYEE